MSRILLNIFSKHCTNMSAPLVPLLSPETYPLRRLMWARFYKGMLSTIHNLSQGLMPIMNLKSFVILFDNRLSIISLYFCYCLFWMPKRKVDSINMISSSLRSFHIKPLNASVALTHIETSQLFCCTNQFPGFYIKDASFSKINSNGETGNRETFCIFRFSDNHRQLSKIQHYLKKEFK